MNIMKMTLFRAKPDKVIVFCREFIVFNAYS